MATIDLGKIKLVWKGTYNNSTAYKVDDLVEYTDTNITSTYICVADSTGNAPSSGGSAHASWNYMAKGVADPIPSQSGNAGKVLKTDGTNASWGVGGGMTKIASNTTTGATATQILLDNVFTTDYKIYKLYISDMDFSTTAKLYARFINSSGSIVTSAQYSWFSFHPYMSSGGATSNIHTGTWNGSTEFVLTGDNVTSTSWPISCEVTIYNPMSSTKKPAVRASSISEEGDRTQMNGHELYMQYLDSGDIRGIQLYPHTGTLNEWNYQLYGVNP